LFVDQFADGQFLLPACRIRSDWENRLVLEGNLR
jgi:hypothetical protein